LRLPFRQESVEVSIETASLSHVSVAFEAIPVTYRNGQGGGLLVGVCEEGNKIPPADQKRSQAPGHAWAGMTVDAAHIFGLMKAGQINGGLLLRPLEEARLGLCVT
jgi:hypothetical protein